ncbi:MAG TPA: hypothetical protein VGL53_16075 [Bryobacteraceae bacterium]
MTAAVAAGTLDAQDRKRAVRIGCKGVHQILKTRPKYWRGD